MAQPVDYNQLQANLREHFETLSELTKLDKKQMISMMERLQIDANASLDEFQGQISKAVWERIAGKEGTLRRLQRAVENGGVMFDGAINVFSSPAAVWRFFSGESQAYAKLVTSPAQAAELARITVEAVKSEQESSLGRWKDVLSNIWSTFKTGGFSGVMALMSYAWSGDMNAIEDQAVKNAVIQTQTARVGVAIRSRIEDTFKADPAMGATIAQMVSGIGAERTIVSEGLIHHPAITVDEAVSSQVRKAVFSILPPPDKTWGDRFKSAGTYVANHPGKATLLTVGGAVVAHDVALTSRNIVLAGVRNFQEIKREISAVRQSGLSITSMFRVSEEARLLAAARAAGAPSMVELAGDMPSIARTAAHADLATTARYASHTVRGVPLRVTSKLMKGTVYLAFGGLILDGIFSAEDAAAVDRRIDDAKTRGQITEREAQIARAYNALAMTTGMLTSGITDRAVGYLADISGVQEGLRPASFRDLLAVEPRSTQHGGNWSPHYTVGEMLAVAKAWDTTPPTHPIKSELIRKIPNLNVSRLIRTLESNDSQDNAFIYGVMSDSRYVEIRKAVEPIAGMAQAYSDLYNRGPLYQRLIRDGFTQTDIQMLLKANSPGYWSSNPDSPSEKAFRMIGRSGDILAAADAGLRLTPATDIEWAAAVPITNIDSALFEIGQNLSLRERTISSVVERPMGKMFTAFIDTYQDVAKAWADASLVQQVTVKVGGTYPSAVAAARAKFSRYWHDQGLPQSQIDAMLDLGTDMLLMGARKDAPQKIRDAFNNLIIYGPKDDLGNSIMANFVRKQPKLTNAEVARLVMSEPFRQWAINQYGQEGFDMIEGQALFNVSSQRSGNKDVAWGSDRGLWGAGEYPGLAAHRRAKATEAERVAFDRLKERIFANLTADFTGYMATEEGLLAHAEWMDNTLMKHLDKLAGLRQDAQATQQALYLAFIPKANEAEFQAQLTRFGIVEPTAVQHVTQLRAALQEKYQMMFKTDDRTYWQQFVDYMNSESPAPRMGIGERALPEAPADFNYRVDAEKEMLMDMIVALMNRVKAAPQFGKVRVSAAEIPGAEQRGVERMASIEDAQARLMRGLVEAAGGVVPITTTRVSLSGAQVVGAGFVEPQPKLAFGNARITGGDEVTLGTSVVARSQPLVLDDKAAKARDLGYSSLFS